MMNLTLSTRSTIGAVISVALPLLAGGAFAQEDVAPELQCVRYLQSYERSMHIPQGLLTAISLVETGRPTGSGKQITAWPWTININGQGKFFDTKEEAIAETRKLMDEGQRSIDVGCLQINLRYHPNAFKSVDEAFDPATNVAYGAEFLNSLHQLQGSWAKAIERYHSSDDGRREEYREKVIAFWNDDARSIVMNAVLAENTDTPYHRAVRDFVAGNYVAALDKYQAIVDLNPKDRLGLLGVAMSYERIGRSAEADQAYARYLSVEPENQNVLVHMIEKARTLPLEQGRTELDNLVTAGVSSPEIYGALAEIAVTTGDYEAAFRYASHAADEAPSATMYHLNAAVLADRLNQPKVAVKYYEQFLALYDHQSVALDAPVDGVRSRLRFLRTKF